LWKRKDFSVWGNHGVIIVSSTKAMLKDNTVSVMNYDIVFAGAPGLYMNNLLSGCSVSFTGGIAAGSTNYSIP